MQPIRTPPRLITLILLAGFSPLSLNMFMPSLANIAADLQTSYGMVIWSVSGYLAITAVIQLIVGPLSDRVGRRPVLICALAIFSIASVGCVLAQDIQTFLFFRMFQGGMTAGYALSLAIVRDTRTEREAVSLIGYIGMSMALAPMLGPVVGGMLDAAFGWRATFVFYAAAGLFLFGLCLVDLGETRRGTTARSDRMGGARALLTEVQFWAYALCSAFSVGGFYIFITGVPLVAAKSFGISTAELGLHIGSITFGFMTGGFIAGRYGARFDLSVLLLMGRLVPVLGLSAGLILFNAGISSPFLFLASTICVGLGNGLSMPSSTTGAMSVRPDLAGSAAGWSGAMIVGCGAVLTAATGPFLNGSGSAPTLLALMLGVSCLAFAFAGWAVIMRRRIAP